VPRFSKLPSLIALSWLTTSSFGGSFVDLLENQQRPADSSRISLSTKNHLEDVVWWPSKGVASQSACDDIKPLAASAIRC
jgi:hypothetical protein